MTKRVKALDGLRGLAVGLILLHHLFQVGGMWVGVDIFFVLSGFLITSILRAERDDVHFWRVFYVRRVTRILPAYVMLITAVVLFAHLKWRLIWPYYTFFGANLANVFFGDPVIGPLSILWSLAVEEHFYFVWPAMVRVFREGSALLWVLSSVIVAEPLLRTIGLRLSGDWWTCYFLTPFRLDGLALGALLSLLLSNPKTSEYCDRWIGKSLLIAMSGCVLLFGIFRISRHHTPWTFNAFGYSAVAITAAMVLAWLVLRPQSLAAKAMSFGPLCFLGRISYGLYLYHWLVRDLVHTSFPHLGLVRNGIIALVVSLLVAWLSFEFVEKRFLSLGKRLVGAYSLSRGSVETTT